MHWFSAGITKSAKPASPNFFPSLQEAASNKKISSGAMAAFYGSGLCIAPAGVRLNEALPAVTN